MAVTGAKFQPYALAIGQMALAWNELHETLGVLFARTLGNEMHIRFQCSAIWGAITSDRQKRLMLNASINTVDIPVHDQFPQMATDILWLTGRANSLEDKRNNVVHSPLDEVTSELVAALIKVPLGEVIPGGVHNERALKLASSTVHVGKDLLGEMFVYRNYAQALTAFAEAVLKEWRKPTGTWPERPDLPPLRDGG